MRCFLFHGGTPASLIGNRVDEPENVNSHVSLNLLQRRLTQPNYNYNNFFVKITKCIFVVAHVEE